MALTVEPEPTTIDHDQPKRVAVWVTFLVALVACSIPFGLKAAKEKSAIVRWLKQIQDLPKGVNIWNDYMFPNPPIFSLSLYPLTEMHPVAAAVVWYFLKAALVVLVVLACLKLGRTEGLTRPVPSWALLAIILIGFRPILGDLHHGNNNIIILSLVVGALYSWTRGFDVLAGLCLALAISYKVTPALFVPYFLYKRSWRMVGATFLGLGIFLVIIPGIVLGPGFNGECFYWWWHRMLRPFVMDNQVGSLEINQSMPGVLTRLVVEQSGQGRYSPESGRNLIALNPDFVVSAIKLLSVGFVALLGWLCRTDPRNRRDPRFLGEFSLVTLTMLIVSERSWKHHYVTILLPLTYLTFRLWAYQGSRIRRFVIGGSLGLAALLMLSTSSEIGRFFADGKGHDLAQYYGMFFWAGILLYLPTAWILRTELGKSGQEKNEPRLQVNQQGPHFSESHWQEWKEQHRIDTADSSESRLNSGSSGSVT